MKPRLDALPLASMLASMSGGNAACKASDRSAIESTSTPLWPVPRNRRPERATISADAFWSLNPGPSDGDSWFFGPSVPVQTARKINYLRRCVLVLESWPERRSPLECDHLARSPCIALDLFVSRQWYPVCWRNQQDRVRNHTKLVDGGRVNVVDVIASIENGRHKSGGNPLLHFFGNRHVTGCECCLSIILRQQNRNVVGRLPLTQQPAYPLQVLR